MESVLYIESNNEDLVDAKSKDDFMKKIFKDAKETVKKAVNNSVLSDPDACKTPNSAGSTNIPFPNFGKSSDSKSTKRSKIRKRILGR